MPVTGFDHIGVCVYVRDPDENLVEFISYEPADMEHYRGDEDPLGSGGGGSG